MSQEFSTLTKDNCSADERNKRERGSKVKVAGKCLEDNPKTVALSTEKRDFKIDFDPLK